MAIAIKKRSYPTLTWSSIPSHCRLCGPTEGIPSWTRMKGTPTPICSKCSNKIHDLWVLTHYSLLVGKTPYEAWATPTSEVAMTMAKLTGHESAMFHRLIKIQAYVYSRRYAKQIEAGLSQARREERESRSRQAEAKPREKTEPAEVIGQYLMERSPCVLLPPEEAKERVSPEGRRRPTDYLYTTINGQNVLAWLGDCPRCGKTATPCARQNISQVNIECPHCQYVYRRAKNKEILIVKP